MSGAERIGAALERCRAAGRPAIVAYLTGGWPTAARFEALVPAVSRETDVLEIGIPFSDPIADGVTIQRASREALAAGTTPRGLLDALAASRPRRAGPTVVMSYLNPLLALGARRFAQAAAAAGVDGVVVPDLPLEESAPWLETLDRAGIALVQLVTPVTPPQRLARIAGAARGFVYAVTVTGVTGTRPDLERLAPYLKRVRAAASVPVLAGFGIRRGEDVARLAAHCDGVVVGTALLDAIARGDDPATLLRELREARLPAEETRP